MIISPLFQPNISLEQFSKARIVCREGGGIGEGRPPNMVPRVSIISCTEPSGCAARKSHSSSIVVTDEARLAGRRLSNSDICAAVRESNNLHMIPLLMAAVMLLLFATRLLGLQSERL